MNKAKQYLLDHNLPNQVVNNNKKEFHDKKNLVYVSDVMMGFAEKVMAENESLKSELQYVNNEADELWHDLNQEQMGR